jgi:glycosyltransferase 2 family protein
LTKLSRRVVWAMLLGVLVYGAIVLYRGVETLAERFARYAWWTFAAACGLAFANYLLRFLKWEYYLAALGIRGIPKRQSLLVFLSGFVLTVTPGKVGEVFKSLILFQLRKVPIATTAPIVVAERVTDLIAVIVMISVGSIAFPGGAVWATAGATLVILLLAFVASPRVSGAALAALPRLPGALGRASLRLLPKIEQSLRQLRTLTTPSRLVLPAALSVIGWSLEGVALWVVLHGFGERAPLLITGFSYATATLAGALVPVPGGLGVTDKLLEEQMAHLGGVAPATATGAMILTRFATLWFAVGVGFAALAILRALHPELSAAEENASPGPSVTPQERPEPSSSEKTP